MFDIAGTIFPSGHEPDYCAGLDGTSVTDVVIHIEDSTGKTWDLHPNEAGNFIIENGVTPPYSASVVSNDGIRAMAYKPMNGDCNLCHTQDGSNGDDPNSDAAPAGSPACRAKRAATSSRPARASPSTRARSSGERGSAMRRPLTSQAYNVGRSIPAGYLR